MYKRAESWLADAQKYRQSGYGSYLVGQGQTQNCAITLASMTSLNGGLPNFVTFLLRISSCYFKLLNDHSIDLYAAKLAS